MSTARIIFFAAIGLVVVALAATALGRRDKPYRLRLQLPNAGGLRDDSAVVIGGIQAGKVQLSLDSKRNVIAELRLDRKYAPVGRDARATIAAVNLLGIKNVTLDPGDKSRPAPDGMTLPKDRVKDATDLDQVLAVLDNDTRTRLAILINEAGAAFAGRREDFAKLVRELPPSIADADRLLRRLVADNDTLAKLVSHSEGFISAMAGQRKSLTRLVDTAGRAGTVVASRRSQLRASLAKAPAALAQLQSFLGRLRKTTVPLGPAARDITASAKPLADVLAQADPFWRAADPLLAEARKASPQIIRLADRATPVLRNAGPVSTLLARTSKSAAPISDTLMQSSDNILAVIDNWSKAVQLRDGLSHVFRGEASYSPDEVQTMVRILQANALGDKHAARAQRGSDRPSGKSPDATPKLRLPDKLPKKLRDTLREVLPSLGSIVGKPSPRSDGGQDTVKPLLDYLLGP